MKKSKYLNRVFGDWECVHVGVARVQPKYKNKRGEDGKKLKNKFPGHQSYYYIFERLTSDRKALKTIQLNANQANLVLKGKRTVEDYAEKKEAKRSFIYDMRVNYCFCD